MSAEERLLDAMDDEEDDELELPYREGFLARRRHRLQHKNRAKINSFLGEGGRANSVIILRRYYSELLAWALQRYVEQEGWEVVRTLSYREPEPVYMDVSTDYDKKENLLIDSQLLLKKGNVNFVVTVDINPSWRACVQIECHASRKREADKFVDGVKAIAKEQNFYRGKKIQFTGHIDFINVKATLWESVVLDPETKNEIMANTIRFLGRREQWAEYGIPSRRGILLAGEPGTGKTMICRALMAEADGLTCITTNAYTLAEEGYISQLYELAQDLSPCLVFIEDIDLIGQNRFEFGYFRGPALMSLLAVLDGVEEHEQIVTIATTNCLDTLDKAIKERPSRFDRVIQLTRPTLEQRRQIISSLTQKIPLDEASQDYIARRTEQFTPAQLKEVIHGLVIQHCDNLPPGCSEKLILSSDDIDGIISRVNGNNKRQLGFNISDNHSGKMQELSHTAKVDKIERREIR